MFVYQRVHHISPIDQTLGLDLFTNLAIPKLGYQRTYDPFIHINPQLPSGKLT
jgi:hypothetical protein